MAKTYRSAAEIHELRREMEECVIILERCEKEMEDNDIDGLELHSSETFNTQWPRTMAWTHKLPWEISQLVRQIRKQKIREAADQTKKT